ncbi:MAG: FG-GAP-like repeat-containing protein [Pseudomonadota bacterium]
MKTLAFHINLLILLIIFPVFIISCSSGVTQLTKPDTMDCADCTDDTGSGGEGENTDQDPNLDIDTDLDGIIDQNDNCIDTPNEDQLDSDEDGLGDACDDENDLDGENDTVTYSLNDMELFYSNGNSESLKYENTLSKVIITNLTRAGQMGAYAISANSTAEGKLFRYSFSSPSSMKEDFSQEINTDINPTDIAICNIDGNPYTVVATDSTTENQARIFIYNNNGNLNSSGADDLPDSVYISSIACGDADGDGDDEVLAGTMSTGNFSSKTIQRWYLYDTPKPEATIALVTIAAGGGQSTSDPNYIGGTWGTNSSVTSVAIGDIDNNGFSEIAIGRKGGADINAKLFIYELNPDNSLYEQKFTMPLGSFFIKDIAYGFQNGENVIAVASSSGTQGENRIQIFSYENATYNFVKSYASEWENNIVTSSIAFGDIDGNGSEELVAGRYTYYSSSIQDFNNSSDKRWVLYDDNTSAEIFAGGGETDAWDENIWVTDVSMGDLNGDGINELAVSLNSNPSQDKIIFYTPDLTENQ